MAERKFQESKNKKIFENQRNVKISSFSFAIPPYVLPSYVVEHVFNGRLTHITNNRINFADEDKEKKGKKKEKKQEIHCILYVDSVL